MPRLSPALSAAPATSGRPEENLPLRSRGDRWGDSIFDHLCRRTLVYNICWEDPALDQVALALEPRHRVLVITSAGCNALDYALAGPREILAVDANPRQNALLELKLAGIRALEFDDFFALFGAGAHPRFPLLYREKLRGQLGVSAREFWDARGHWFHAERPLHHHGLCGLFSRLIRRACQSLPGLWHDIETVFAIDSLTEQAAYYDRRIRPRLWNPAIRWILSRESLLALLGVPSAQRHLITSQYPRGIAGFVEEAVDSLFRTLPARENYFWYLYTFGRFAPACCPRYLTPTGFARLKRGAVDAIRVQTDTVTGLLRRETEPFDRFVLLDHLDWMTGRDPAALEMEWTEIRRCSRPGARILFRSAHKQPPFLQSVRTGPHREPLTQWLRFHAQLAEDLHARDRVHTYASFHIAEACHP